MRRGRGSRKLESIATAWLTVDWLGQQQQQQEEERQQQGAAEEEPHEGDDGVGHALHVWVDWRRVGGISKKSSRHLGLAVTQRRHRFDLSKPSGVLNQPPRGIQSPRPPTPTQAGFGRRAVVVVVVVVDRRHPNTTKNYIIILLLCGRVCGQI